MTTWASSSHFRHPWFDASVSKRKNCDPVDDFDPSSVPKRRRLCNTTLEHGFSYLSIGNPTMDAPWTSLANGSRSFVPVNSSTMDSDIQPVYTVEKVEPKVPDVNMKTSSWYEPEPDRIVITDLDLFTESDDEGEREESVNINPMLLDHIRGKERSKNSLHPKATSTALVLFRPLPGPERWQGDLVTQANEKDPVDENAMDLEP